MTASRTLRLVERRIVGFVADDVGDWVALLDCFHRRHVRHRPPLWPNAWVEDATGRAEHIGAGIDCGRCDRCELPDDLVVARTTATWDEHTLPTALRRAHRVAAGTWGRLRVEAGRLRFVAATVPPTDVEVVAGGSQAIPPDVEHAVEPLGAVRFAVEFLVAGPVVVSD